MNNFETELSGIDKRAEAYNSRLADINNTLKKMFEKCKTHREQIINAINIITKREGSHVVITKRTVSGVTSYEVCSEPCGFRVRISRDEWITCVVPDPRLIDDDVDSLDSAEQRYVDLNDIEESNQRIDNVLEAYLQRESLRVKLLEDRFENLLNKFC